VAAARRDGEILRGEGDATRNGIFASAFGQDPEFFEFYRSMQAYSQALQNSGTTMVLSPNSDFFRFFENPQGSAKSQPGTAAPNQPATAPPPAAAAAEPTVQQ
jgi:membrane protease subunit HflC